MLDFLFSLLANGVSLLVGIGILWMIVHAALNRRWLWLVFLVVFPGFSTVFYFLTVFLQSNAGNHGFELPGAADRRRIKQLESQIHNLDKAIFHAQLGDIYFQQGKFAKAEGCYRAALERESDDEDAQSHFGQSLLRQGKIAEALPVLRAVATRNPRHEYGYTLMAYAEALTAAGEKTEARAVWEQVVAGNTYARARVQLAELLLEAGKPAEARALLDETIADAEHAPAFQRAHEKVWVRKAKLLRRR